MYINFPSLYEDEACQYQPRKGLQMHKIERKYLVSVIIVIIPTEVMFFKNNIR